MSRPGGQRPPGNEVHKQPASAAAVSRAAGLLVERDEPLRALQDSLGIAARGTGGVALVSGEAGIGKTAILRALADSRGGARLWWGACDALETPSPLGPLFDISRSSEANFGAQLLADSDRTALFESFIGELQTIAKPTLLVIEDVHWADEATLDLLKFVGRRIDRVPCLLVASYRDDEVGANHPLRRVIGDLPSVNVTHIELPRLSPEAVEALARGAFRSPEGIYEVTGGNPFFVTELLRGARDKMPRSVQDLVLGRFAHLSSDAQVLLQAVSIVPRQIERWLVESLVAVDERAIEQCLNSGLLDAGADSLRFRHELARIVIEETLSAPAARALHSRVLKALEGRTEHLSAARLAHHATRAWDEGAVLRYAPPAAREAALRRAHREALAHYKAAFACPSSSAAPERVRWLEAYAQECQFTAQLEEAIDARKTAADLHRQAGDAVEQAENLSELALAYFRAGRVAEADAASLESIELLEAHAPSIQLAHAYRIQAHIRLLCGDRDAAIPWSKKAIELAERFGGRDVLAAALGVFGAATAFTDYDAGCNHLRRAFDVAVDEGLEFLAAVICNNLGWVSFELYRFREAREHFLRAVAFARQHDIDSADTFATSALAMCEMHLGRWDEAERSALHVIDGSDRTVSRLTALLALARVRLRRGDPGVTALLDEASAFVASSAPYLTGELKIVCAEEALLRGDHVSALNEARSAQLVARAHNRTWFIGEAAYIMHCSGASEIPRERLAEPFRLQIEGRFREAATQWDSIGCMYEQARALAEGDSKAQLEALEIFERLGAVPAADALRRRLRAAAVRGVPRGSRASTKANPSDLTERELEVLTLLCEGLKNSEIAQRLVLSTRTVDHHVAGAFAKLRVSTRTEAVAAALRLGISAPPRG